MMATYELLPSDTLLVFELSLLNVWKTVDKILLSRRTGTRTCPDKITLLEYLQESSTTELLSLTKRRMGPKMQKVDTVWKMCGKVSVSLSLKLVSASRAKLSKAAYLS